MRSVTNMSERNGIAVVGTALVDKINEISAYPNSGELTKISSVSKAVGGCVPNVAIDIKRFDPSIEVKAVYKVGHDSDGDFLTDSLSENGVDTSCVSIGEVNTSFSDVMSVKGGQRTFFTYPGACADFGIDDIKFDELNVKLFHLGYFLLLDKVDNGDGKKILQKAKEYGFTTSIDLVSENSDRYYLVKECLPFTDNLIINELEAGMLTGITATNDNLEEIARKLRSMGVSEKVIIHTKEIGVCLSDNGFFTQKSYNIPKEAIKGTTGAGDAFCAGSLVGIYRGLSETEILTLATKAASVSLTKADAISGMCKESEIDAILDKIIV